ncbi:MAG: twin-arginine translocase subunit TatC, partial [Desulfovibrionaceae bacterium]|nr:twin-arginine translocase subunit TatC [Desulfovibrionaceae bacterium]
TAANASGESAATQSEFDSFAFTGPEWRPDEPSATAAPAQADESLPATAQPTAPAASTQDDPQPDDASGPEASMGLMDHLNELRVRLVRCTIAVGLGFIACWSGVEYLFNILVAPLLAALPAGSHAQYLSLPEAFFTRMYIAFVAGVFAVSPYIFYQIWAFIAPGLYDEEKRYVIPIAVLSAIFFIGGGAFCYFIVFPYAFDFFVSFSTQEIVVMPKISDYLGFVLKLLIAFGLIFEMPLFSLFLSRMGLISAALMRRVRRYAVLVIFVVAAILTPPDVVSQLLMAGPMLILYECSIWVAALFGRKKKPKEADRKDGDTPDDHAEAV